MSVNWDDLSDNNPNAVSWDKLSDSPPKKPEKGIVNDTLVGLGKGVMQLPAAAAGLADIPAGLVGLNRPVSRAADAIGEVTGFKPSVWAKEADKDYSPQMQEAKANVNQAWDDPNTNGLDVAKSYIQNPRAIASTVVESLPSMAAGNMLGKAVTGFNALSPTATTAEIVKRATIASGVGEGSIMAGQSMDNIDKSVNPLHAALAATAIGVGGGVIGTQSGRIANKLGFGDADTAFVSGGRAGLGAVDDTGKPIQPMWKRVVGGAITEGPIEEGSQSALETGAQNFVEGKPITKGMARNVAEGSIAGVAMGAPMGVLSRAANAAPQPVTHEVQPEISGEQNEQRNEQSGDASIPDSLPTSTASDSNQGNTSGNDSVSNGTTRQPTSGSNNNATDNKAATGAGEELNPDNSGLKNIDENSKPVSNVDSSPEIKAKINKNREELTKAYAAKGDNREISIGDKKYSADSFIWGQILHGGNTFDDAKNNFDSLYSEQNPQESAKNDEERTGTSRIDDAAANSILVNKLGPTSTNDNADNAGGTGNDGLTPDGPRVSNGGSTSGGTGGSLNDIPGSDGDNTGGQDLHDTGKLPDTELTTDETKKNDTQTIHEKPKTNAAPDESQPAPGPADTVDSSDDTSKALKAHQEELSAIDKQEAYIRKNKAGDSFNSYQKEELKKISQKRKSINQLIENLTNQQEVTNEQSNKRAIADSGDGTGSEGQGARIQPSVNATTYAGENKPGGTGAIKPDSDVAQRQLDEIAPDNNGAFTPTHELNDGTPVRHVEDNTYVDANNDEWQADNAIPIKNNGAKKTDKTDSTAQPAAQGANPLAPGSSPVSEDKKSEPVGKVAEDKVNQGKGPLDRFSDYAETDANGYLIDKGALKIALSSTDDLKEKKAIKKMAKKMPNGDVVLSPDFMDKIAESHLWTRDFLGQKIDEHEAKTQPKNTKENPNVQSKDTAKINTEDQKDQGQKEQEVNDQKSEIQPVSPDTGADSAGITTDAASVTGTPATGAGAQTPEVATRIGKPNGEPFATKGTANSVIKKRTGLSPETHEIEEDNGKFWIVPKTVQQSPSPTNNEQGEKVDKPTEKDSLFSTLKDGDIVNVEFKSPDRTEKMRVIGSPFTTQQGHDSVNLGHVDGRAGSVFIPLSQVSLSEELKSPTHLHESAHTAANDSVKKPSNMKAAETKASSKNSESQLSKDQAKTKDEKHTKGEKIDTSEEKSPEYLKAKADLDEALGDLGQVFLAANIFAPKAVPTQLSAKDLMPVLTRVMDAAFRMGYAQFKENSKFVLDTIRAKFGDVAADSITLKHLKGAYIGMGEGTTSEDDVIAVKSIEELVTQKLEKAEIPESEQQDAVTNDNGDTFKVGDIVSYRSDPARKDKVTAIRKGTFGGKDVMTEEIGGTRKGMSPEGSTLFHAKEDDSLSEQISKKFNGAKVSNVKVDDEFGNVTATVDGKTGIDAGFIEDYKTKNNTSAASKEGVSLEPNINEVERDDEHSRNGGDSKGVLEGSVPGTLSVNGKKGATSSRSGSRSGTNAKRNGSAKGSRNDGTGSLGGSEGAVSSEEAGRLLDQQLEADLVGDDFVIDDNELGHSTYGERLANNMAAIRLVKQLEQEGRKPTQEEKETLSHFAGWGALKNVFNPYSKAKQDRVALEELQGLRSKDGNLILDDKGNPVKAGLLDDNELFWAKQGVLAQHFTSPEVVNGIYDTLNHMGYTGGNALEPTVGVGNFIGAMPLTMKGATNWYASEIDPIPGKIAQYLYPESTILTGTGFQKAEFPYNKFDLVIGNPPFGDERITDKNPARKAINHFKIHNYIIAKSAMHLKPGGVMAFVVTNRFLDTKDSEARAFLAENFNMLAAVRLPNNAFKKNAGTEVTTDIIFLQKRMPGQAEGNTDWLNTQGSMTNVDGEPITLNEYFANHPDMMLGKPSMQGTMYAGRGDGERKEFTLIPHEGKTIFEQMQGLLDGPLADMKDLLQSEHNEILDAQSTTIEMNRDDVAIGGFFMDGDNVFMRDDDDENGNAKFEKLTPATQWTEKSTLGVTRYNRIKGMLGLRSAAYNLVDAERADRNDIESFREALNERYDAFVKNYGYINSTANAGLMAGDIKIEFGLEKNYKKAITAAKSKSSGFEQAKESADKADILKERVFYPYKEILAAANPRDGYSISLSEKGGFDADYIAGLTGLSTDEVIKELSTGENPLIYKDPETGEWVQEDEYLSGNVKKKLKEAKGLRGYEKNVEELTKVLPKDVTQEEVFANIGQTWIPGSVYSQFMDELGVSGARVAIDNHMGSVTVTGSHSINPSAIGKGFENSDYSLPELFNLIANRKAVVAYDYDEKRNRSVNQDRTKELQIIARRMTAFFKDWIFADTMRADDLVKLYNDTQNTTVERKSEGKNLRTVGANPSTILRDTQKSAAWRMIQSPSVLLDHVVGSGKTMTIITGIMERKRMGLSKKPMLVVPNHIVSQWAKEFVELYPGANLLVASEKDFQKQNRRRLFARIATGKYDAIILGHSSFKFIAMDPATEQQFIRDELKLLEDALSTAKDNEDKRAVRTIRNRIAKRMERLNKLNSAPKDDVVSFDQMGIDYLAIDESHMFKNLEYATGMQRVSGMGTPNGSQRAFDLYMKLRTLLDRDNGGVTFATGTPISNSLVEMYTIMRYLNKQGLIDRNIESFDAWAKNYANVEPAIEYTATGKLKERTIMGTFNNVPEMMQLYKEFADVVTMNDLKRIYSEQVARTNKEKGENNRTEFPVPKVANGGRQLIKAQPSAEQLEYMDYLIERTLQVEEDMNTKGFDPTKDNLLWIYNDAKKAALDIRLVDPSAPDNPDSKVNKAVDNIVELYHKWHDDKGTQLVFIDMSTPGKSSVKDANDLLNSIYKRLKIKPDSTEDKTVKVLETYKEKWNYLQFKLNELLEYENISEDDIETLQAFIDETVAESEVFSTADSGFSVYDDIKTKLLGKGIPANEVQFIHDYKTAIQKQELFALVNSGKVRVLLGSTAKMGAGTNAQERMVGLKHIDSSQHNRPSDIEQREGRIIRQGNKLYERDPDGFEVEILAYSTEKTFDAVSWQTLGKKARMLDSFRSGERTVEENQSDTASYLEFMAETTGNPIFREKIKLEGEISELETDERRLGAQLSAANRTVANAEGDARTNENRIKQVKDALDDLGKADTYSFNGETFKNDYDAVFRKEWEKYDHAKTPYNLALQEYAVARAEYDKAEKGNRGKAPAKPKEPEYPHYDTEAMQSKSEAARFIKKLAEAVKALEKDGDGLQFKVGDLPIDVELTIKADKMMRVGSTTKFINIYDKYGLAGFEITDAQIDHIVNLVNKFSRHTYNEVLESREDRAKKQAEQVKISKEFIANNKFTGAEDLAAKKARYEEVKAEVDSIEAVEAERRSQHENKYVKADTARFPSGSTRGMSELAERLVRSADLAVFGYTINDRNQKEDADGNILTEEQADKLEEQLQDVRNAKEQSGEIKFSKAPQQSVSAFSEQIKEELGLKAFHVFENSRGDIELSSLIVNKDEQRSGKGTAAMNKLINYADSVGKRIILTPGLPNDSHGTTSRARLVKFYKSFGFVESRGRNIDYAIGAGKMYRNPGQLFSKAQQPATGSTVADIKAMLPSRVNKLIESGNLIIAQKASDVIGGAQSFDAGAVEGFYNNKTDKLYLIADSITKDNINAVLNHELFHRALNTDPKLQEAVKSFNGGMQERFDLASQGKASAIENAAAKRVINANTPAKDQLEEFQAYMITEYNKNPDSFTGAIKKLIQDFIAAIRMALLKAGIPLSNLTPADLNALAKMGAKVNNGTKAALTELRDPKLVEIRQSIEAYSAFIKCLAA